MKNIHFNRRREFRRTRKTNELRQLLDDYDYCCVCNKPGRAYQIGKAAEFFRGHARGDVVLCKVCWLDYQPLIQQLHMIHTYQRLLRSVND